MISVAGLTTHPPPTSAVGAQGQSGGRLIMALRAVHGLDILLMPLGLTFKIQMAVDAGEVTVNGFGERRFIEVDRDLFSRSGAGEVLVLMANQTIGILLGPGGWRTHHQGQDAQ